MTRARIRLVALPALVALAHLAMPDPVHAAGMLVPVCGQGISRVLPIRNRDADRDSDRRASCKICHSAMRKRASGSSCCDGEDESDDT